VNRMVLIHARVHLGHPCRLVHVIIVDVRGRLERVRRVLPPDDGVVWVRERAVPLVLDEAIASQIPDDGILR
jgi:hypothetical protein